MKYRKINWNVKEHPAGCSIQKKTNRIMDWDHHQSQIPHVEYHSAFFYKSPLILVDKSFNFTSILPSSELWPRRFYCIMSMVGFWKTRGYGPLEMFPRNHTDLISDSSPEGLFPTSLALLSMSWQFPTQQVPLPNVLGSIPKVPQGKEHLTDADSWDSGDKKEVFSLLHLPLHQLQPQADRESHRFYRSWFYFSLPAGTDREWEENRSGWIAGFLEKISYF